MQGHDAVAAADPSAIPDRPPWRPLASAAFGVALWLAVALFIRWLAGPAGWLEGGWQTGAMFLAAVALAAPLVALLARTVRLRERDVLPSVTVACAAAMLCDGIALVWTPLYGPSAGHTGAWLLWAVAWIELAALRRRS